MSESNGYASRDQLLAPARRRFRDVELPIRGLKVRIRSLMESESESFQAEMLSRGKLNRDKAISSYRRLILLCVCDENGTPIFNQHDFEALNSWDGADINHLGRECELHCGFVEGEIERMEKNFETASAAS